MGERQEHYRVKGFEVRIYNRYILSLALLFTLTTVILSFSAQSQLDLYFSVYLIECLVVTSLFVYLNPKAMKRLNAIWYVLFGGFMVIVAMKVVEILFGIRL